MALPVDRATFRKFILRQLGDGVTRVNVSDEQVDDAIDFALRKGADYHFDFSSELFFQVAITDSIKAAGGFALPSNVLGAVEIFDLSSTFMGGDIFNAQYQFVLNNIWEWQSGSLMPYFMAFQHLQFIEEILVGKQAIRYNRYENFLYVDMDWTKIDDGAFMVVKCYQVLDPNTYVGIWADTWLIKYATACLKKTWGTILKKYDGMEMPGGMKFNGQGTYDEAIAELKELDDQLLDTYSLPNVMMIG